MMAAQGRLRLSKWLITVLLCFIWGNSMLPGSVSGAISDAVKNFLAWLMPAEIPGVTSGGGLLRKIAHFTEFAALGACLGWWFGILEKRKIMALVYSFGAACLDETIQVFVPDRGPGLKDVAIDTCGAAVGLGLLILGQKLARKIQTSKENKTL